jgi:hypothetical protein
VSTRHIQITIDIEVEGDDVAAFLEAANVRAEVSGADLRFTNANSSDDLEGAATLLCEPVSDISFTVQDVEAKYISSPHQERDE